MTEPTAQTASGEFRLDVELAEQAVVRLEEVRERLAVLRQQAAELATTPATAHDPVSLEASALLARTADGGPGSFTAAMDAGMTYVDELVDRMRAEITEQQELDRAEAAGLQRRG